MKPNASSRARRAPISTLRLARLLVWAGLLVGTTGGVTRGQCTGKEQQKLTASDGAWSDRLGDEVAVSGSFAIFGVAGRNDQGAASGAAYVFADTGAGWSQSQKLFPSDPRAGQVFGSDVAADGPVAVVAAAGDDDLGTFAGAAYVFRLNGTTWIEEQKLRASDGEAFDDFGVVSVSEDVILVGAWRDKDANPGTGSAYVYRFDGLSWVEEQKLTPGDSAGRVSFGSAVAVDGNVAVMSSPVGKANGVNSGVVYVFRHDGTSWIEEQKLFPSDQASLQVFGRGVDVDGNLIVVGSPGDDDRGTDSGSAYVFRFDGTSWVEEQKLLPADGAAMDAFGESVSMKGGVVAVGSENTRGPLNGSGAAYLFRSNGVTWVEVQKQVPSPSSNAVGCEVAVGDEVVLAGAYADSQVTIFAGAVFVFPILELAFDVSPESAGVGDTVSLTGCGGLGGAPVLLFVVDVNGTPTFLRLATGRYDPLGVWDFGGTVPPGLQGFVVTLQELGFHAPGSLAISNPDALTLN